MGSCEDTNGRTNCPNRSSRDLGCVFRSGTRRRPGPQPLPAALRAKAGPSEVGVWRPASRSPSAGQGFPPSLTCIVVKHSGHILLWEGVVGVAHQQAGFPHGAVPHHHTLEHLLLLRAPAAAAPVTALGAAHPRGSSCRHRAAAVASPASPEAHGAREAGERRARDHPALLRAPGITRTCPRQPAHALALTILVRKGSTHLGE